MEVLYPRCAGLDVHAGSVTACARIATGATVTYEHRTVSKTTRGLLELVEWLTAHGCTHVAMEATGVYWKPVWHVLEEHFALILANAMHIRNVPGRKSDMNDATWIADLLAHGLIRSSFVLAKVPCVAGHPTDIIFLTCDAFGVLPPVSKLTPEQAMYHFISGYTAKVAGTEMGVTDPSVTFSACFGAPFLVWHPAKYAGLLVEKLKAHKVNVWLINTGWSGGGYGIGARIKLKFRRAMVDAIHDGTLASAPTLPDQIFGIHAVTQVPADILIPDHAWADKDAFAAAARKLAGLFIENFKEFESGATPEVKAAGPRV